MQHKDCTHPRTPYDRRRCLRGQEPRVLNKKDFKRIEEQEKARRQRFIEAHPYVKQPEPRNKKEA
ncbi:hypothetical protein DVB87_25985 [Tsukamurella tyrosinosolvens]|nr:hypothetical protein DVB87_25985 [Tsukamurella tyrosinosolvens]